MKLKGPEIAAQFCPFQITYIHICTNFYKTRLFLKQILKDLKKGGSFSANVYKSLKICKPCIMHSLTFITFTACCGFTLREFTALKTLVKQPIESFHFSVRQISSLQVNMSCNYKPNHPCTIM